jgi:hypothetical protein
LLCCFAFHSWGSKLLELQGDKTAIAVGDKSKLVPVLDKLIGAVRVGELDAATDKASLGKRLQK